jgi:putative ABC transport system permease protein
MSTVALLGALELGLILGFVAVAVYLTFRVLDFPDLTVEGTFPLGAAVAATLIASKTTGPVMATVLGTCAGAAAGMLTGWLNTRLRIVAILSGILVMTALYSINLRVMGRPNLPLLGEETLFTLAARSLSISERAAVLVVVAVVVVVIFTLLCGFMISQLGLALRAAGANPRMARANGVGVDRMVIVGLAISNALAAFAGALFAQSHGAAVATMGFGIIVIGLASVVVGEGLFSARTVVVAILACLVGSVLYRFVVTLALNSSFLGLHAQDLSLVTAVLVAVAVVLGRARRKRAGDAALRARAAEVPAKVVE